MYISTRGKDRVSASAAIIKGLALDGGLYMIESIPKLSVDETFCSLSYNEQAKIILKEFLDDFTDAEIDEAVAMAYNDENFYGGPIFVDDYSSVAFFNLYQGRTFAFKDVALTIFPYLLSTAIKKQGFQKKLTILTATSGDTGSAAIAGISQIDDIGIIVLYPSTGISVIQEKQMLSIKKQNVHAIAVDGNFDDCQKIVKQAFSEIQIDGISLSSANSINIARLVPQIVYYYNGYVSLVNKARIKLGEKINVVVPTGNFGNILALYIAKQMGLPINMLVCASNKNNVLTDFFNKGIYDAKRKFYQTNSPSMDILVSSNLERYIYLSTKDSEYVDSLMKRLNAEGYYEVNNIIREANKQFIADFLDEETTIDAIATCYKKLGVLLDPHSAVAYGVYEKCKEQLQGYTAIACTASPYKFSSTIVKALQITNDKDDFVNIDNIFHMTGLKPDSRLNSLRNVERKRVVWKKEEAIRNIKQILEG